MSVDSSRFRSTAPASSAEKTYTTAPPWTHPFRRALHRLPQSPTAWCASASPPPPGSPYNSPPSATQGTKQWGTKRAVLSLYRLKHHEHHRRQGAELGITATEAESVQAAHHS